MKKSLWINAGLLALVVALGLAAWLKPSSRDAEIKLSTLKAADAKAIEIVTAGAPGSIVIERNGTDWQLSEPFPARAEAFVVNRLLELLDARAAEKFPAEGLARYGLNEPSVKVTIDRQLFSFGAFNEMSREQYVQSGDGVYLLPLRYAAALPKSPYDLVAKQLFAADEAPIAFDFGSFKVTQENGKSALEWTTATLPKTDAGPDDINRWIDEWRLAGALKVQPPTQRKPVGALQLLLKSGRTVIIRILERGANTVIARDDQQFEYLLSAPVAARLLAPPGKPAAAEAPALPAK